MPNRIDDRKGWKGTRLLSHRTKTVAEKWKVEDRNEVNFNSFYILEETGLRNWMSRVLLGLMKQGRKWIQSGLHVE